LGAPTDADAKTNPSPGQPPSRGGADERPTADRILDAAEALFAERGFNGTSVRDIASSVALNPASLYNHFTSKEALYEAVLARGIRPLIEVLERAAESEELEAGEIIEAVMDHLAATPHLPRLIYHEALTGGEHLGDVVRNWVQPLLVPALAATERSRAAAGWESDEVVPLIAAWLHMIFGHFAIAPMLGELFGHDPLTPENLERQTRFLRKAALRLVGDEPGPS
jgi:TetR/AcrR family transcriptional regulator